MGASKPTSPVEKSLSELTAGELKAELERLSVVRDAALTKAHAILDELERRQLKAAERAIQDKLAAMTPKKEPTA